MLVGNEFVFRFVIVYAPVDLFGAASLIWCCPSDIDGCFVKYLVERDWGNFRGSLEG